MLNIFGISFLVFYVIIKWRYVLPSIFQKKTVSLGLWPFSLAAACFALASLGFNVPSVQGLPYTQLFCAVVAVAVQTSKAHQSCIVSVLLSAIYILRYGTLAHGIVAVVGALLLFKYAYHYFNQSKMMFRHQRGHEFELSQFSKG